MKSVARTPSLPKELSNYPYIHFWHRLDTALAAENIAGMGDEILGDDAWADLFLPGALAENNNIIMAISTTPRINVQLQALDQLGVERPAGTFGDIGAVEM